MISHFQFPSLSKADHSLKMRKGSFNSEFTSNTFCRENSVIGAKGSVCLCVSKYNEICTDFRAKKVKVYFIKLQIPETQATWLPGDSGIDYIREKTFTMETKDVEIINVTDWMGLGSWCSVLELSIESILLVLWFVGLFCLHGSRLEHT